MDRKKYVVIMAAGSGTIMGAQLPKQFLELGGKVILTADAHSTENLLGM